MFVGVDKGFRDHEIGRLLDVVGQFPGDAGVDGHRDGGARCGLVDGGLEPTIDQYWRCDTAGQLPQLGKGFLSLGHGLSQHLAGPLRVLFHLFAGAGQIHIESHESLLWTVVNVAFQLPQGSGLGALHRSPRVTELSDLGIVAGPQVQQGIAY